MPNRSFEFGLDGVLADYGALLQVDISAPLQLQEYLSVHNLPAYSVHSGHALIDTGAGVSAIDESIFLELEIPYVETEVAFTPSGAGEFKTFNASACFPQLAFSQVPLNGVLGCDLRGQLAPKFDLIMLIGRDLLREFVLLYDGPGSRFTLRHEA